MSDDEVGAIKPSPSGDIKQKKNKRNSILGLFKSKKDKNASNSDEEANGVDLTTRVSELEALHHQDEEQLLQIMDQLANISQQLADERMSKAEVEDENSRLREQHDVLDGIIKDKENKLREIRERVVFENVELVEKRFKKVSAENEELKRENEKLKGEVKEREEENEKVKQELASLQEEHTLTLSSLSETEKRLSSSSSVESELRSQLIESEKSRNELLKQLNETSLSHSKEISKILKSNRDEQEEREKRHSEALSLLENQLADLSAERNSFKRKAESIGKDLQKIVKATKDREEEDNGLKIENKRLLEEIERKSKSLQDALEALSMYMNEAAGLPPPSPVPSPSSAPGPSPSRSKSTLEVDNDQLTDLANRLSITVSEKEDIVSNLKQANMILGKRVLGLEAKLKEYEDLP